MSRRVPWSFLLLTATLAGFGSAADDTTKASNTPTKAPANSKSRQIFAPTDYGFDPDSALLLSLLNNPGKGGYEGSGYGGSNYGGYGGGPYPWMNPLAFPASFSNYGYASQTPYQATSYGSIMPQPYPQPSPMYSQPQTAYQPLYQAPYGVPAAPYGVPSTSYGAPATPYGAQGYQTSPPVQQYSYNPAPPPTYQTQPPPTSYQPSNPVTSYPAPPPATTYQVQNSQSYQAQAPTTYQTQTPTTTYPTQTPTTSYPTQTPTTSYPTQTPATTYQPPSITTSYQAPAPASNYQAPAPPANYQAPAANYQAPTQQYAQPAPYGTPYQPAVATPSGSYAPQPSGPYATGYSTAPVSYAPQPMPVYNTAYSQPNGYGSSFQDTYSYLYGLGSSLPYDRDIYDRDFSKKLGSALYGRSKRSVDDFERRAPLHRPVQNNVHRPGPNHGNHAQFSASNKRH